MKFDKEEIIKNINSFYIYTKENNINMANKYAKALYRIQKIMNDTSEYYSILDDMLSSDNAMVKSWACVVCIDIDYKKNDAIEILKELTLSSDEIVSRTAAMAYYAKCKIDE